MKKIASGAALALAATTLVATATAAPSQAAGDAQGNRSLAEVLTADGDHFDDDSADFDILTEAALAVIEADPDSPVALLADGSQRLTVFAPDDRAFRRLGKALLGEKIDDEEELFGALAEAVGIETIENVLLYHVVPGATITAKQALKADGAELPTALGEETLTVNITRNMTKVKIVDSNPDTNEAAVKIPDINKGNKQIAHGISRVRLPGNL